MSKLSETIKVGDLVYRVGQVVGFSGEGKLHFYEFLVTTPPKKNDEFLRLPARLGLQDTKCDRHRYACDVKTLDAEFGLTKIEALEKGIVVAAKMLARHKKELKEANEEAKYARERKKVHIRHIENLKNLLSEYQA